MAMLPPMLLFPAPPLPLVYFPPPLLQHQHDAHVYGFDDNQRGYLLLGKVLGKNITSLRIDDLVHIWELDGEVRTKTLGEGFFLFSFDLETDFIRAWSHGTVFKEGGGGCLLVRKWRPGLTLDLKIMTFAQIWVQLPNLDGEYRENEEIIGTIASVVGEPMAVDVSGEEVRVCVEVDVNEPLKLTAEVDGGDGGLFLQPFRYEVPGVCFDCGRLDHKREYCHHPHPPCPRNRGGEKKNNNAGWSQVLAPRKEGEEQKKRPPVHFFSWSRPVDGWVKLNFDGSYKERSGRAGGGGLLRDAEGSFIAAFAVALDTSRPLMAEIGALKRGLKVALRMNVQRIMIEGDSKMTIELLTGKRTPKGEEETAAVSFIRQLLEGFEETICRHEFREANTAADHLANMAVVPPSPMQMEWHHHPPQSLIPFLLHDQMSRVVPRLFSL